MDFHGRQCPTPKNGAIYLCLIVARISTLHQDPRSLEDQVKLCRQWLEQRLHGKVTVEVIQSQGSGEIVDRAELRRLEEAIESNEFDILIVEDLGRICRRHRANDFLELAEDHETRVISINDNIDTLESDWRVKAGFASIHHEISNADTSKRIRRTLRNRFANGGVVQCLPAFYVKPHPGASDAEVFRDPGAESIVLGIVGRLEGGASYYEVVDWLNAQQVPTGQYARSKRWTVGLLSRLIHNPILKGVRVRNRRKSKRVNKTGRRKAVPAAPGELLERHCPHLAFIEPERYDRLIEMLDHKNAHYRRKGKDNCDSRKNIPKKRTRFPGQQVYCAICRHPFVWGGHGQMQRMMCKGAKEYRCWQAATFDGESAAKKILAAVFDQIAALPEFDTALVQQVGQEYARVVDARHADLDRVERAIVATDRKLENFYTFIAEGAVTEGVRAKILELETHLAGLRRQRGQLRNRPVQAPKLPGIDEIKRLGRQAIESHAGDPYALSRLMRTLIPRIIAHPVRLCDGGAVYLRAKFDLNLTGIFPELKEVSSALQILTVTMQIDLFEPVQREQHRETVVSMRKAGHEQRWIAKQLGITQPAVQNALKLQRAMDERGLDEPYVPVCEPPEDLMRMRRHRHPRYRFQPWNELEVE